MFRFSQDRLPVALITALTLVDFCVFLVVDRPAFLLGYFILMTIPRGVVCAWSHHHQHCATFRSTALNRLLEVSYALHTGTTTNLWFLHHVVGHHVNYLDQSKDESSWTRKDGSKMGELEYTWWTTLTAYPRAFVVGRRFPKAQRQFVIFTVLTLLLVATLVWFRPLAGLLVFALPMLVSLTYTAWVTYDHHAGLETDDAMSASYNVVNAWYNRWTGNLGYHTAHHLRPGIHWSKLPALHASIEASIPRHLYRGSYLAPSTWSGTQSPSSDPA